MPGGITEHGEKPGQEEDEDDGDEDHLETPTEAIPSLKPGDFADGLNPLGEKVPLFAESEKGQEQGHAHPRASGGIVPTEGTETTQDSGDEIGDDGEEAKGGRVHAPYCSMGRKNLLLFCWPKGWIRICAKIGTTQMGLSISRKEDGWGDVHPPTHPLFGESFL